MEGLEGQVIAFPHDDNRRRNTVTLIYENGPMDTKRHVRLDESRYKFVAGRARRVHRLRVGGRTPVEG